MYSVYKQFIYFMFLSFSTAIYAASTIDESDVEALIQSFISAGEKRDAEAIGKLFADDAKIEMAMPGSQKRFKLNVAQYLQNLEQGWRVVNDYTYQLEDVVIKVGANKKSAYVTGTLIETATFKKVITSTRIRERFTVLLVDGNVCITELVGVIEEVNGRADK